MTPERKLAMRAAVNEWISDRFPDHRMLLSHETPVYEPSADAWNVTLTTKRNGVPAVPLGVVVVAHDGCIVVAPERAEVLAKLPDHVPAPVLARDVVSGDWWDFRHGDGIAAAAELPNRSIDLLLTDPPYGISQRYTCETQVPRRLRKDGSDFIMPKGHFGDWDIVDPHEWTEFVLPKVGGWAVTFCAQAQIGIYTDIFTDHGFVAVGPMVWQKTNPVPFNHRYKPVNAWEAVMVGKRPGTPFGGEMVHNVFVHKSPSPQQRIHPTQKPLPLISEFVGLFSESKGLVFDPFAGSGTTVIAARQQGRVAIGYELDPALFAVAAQRVEAELANNLLL